MIFNITVEKLKQKIKDLSNQSSRQRKLANSKKSKEKHKIQMNKRDVLGPKIRHHLLAYGFLRGKSIKQLEPETTRKAIDKTNVKDIVERFTKLATMEFLSSTYAEMTNRNNTIKKNQLAAQKDKESHSTTSLAV